MRNSASVLLTDQVSEQGAAANPDRAFPDLVMHDSRGEGRPVIAAPAEGGMAMPEAFADRRPVRRVSNGR
jgi:hypothetical protein